MKKGGGAEPFFRLQIGSTLCSLERNLPLPIALFRHLSPPLSLSLCLRFSLHICLSLLSTLSLSPRLSSFSPPLSSFFLPSSSSTERCSPSSLLPFLLLSHPSIHLPLSSLSSYSLQFPCPFTPPIPLSSPPTSTLDIFVSELT